MRNKFLVAFVAVAVSSFTLAAFAAEDVAQENEAENAIEAPAEDPEAPRAPERPAQRKTGTAKKEGSSSSGGAAPAPAPTPAPTVIPANVSRALTLPGENESGPCQYNGALACEKCLVFWVNSGNDRNNHFCKDKSRANKTKGWDCFNFVEDTSHGYQCISYCPPETPTCKDHCDQKHADGSAYHDHPLRRTQNNYSGRIMGPPGSAPEKNKGLESRDKCNW